MAGRKEFTQEVDGMDELVKGNRTNTKISIATLIVASLSLIATVIALLK